MLGTAPEIDTLIVPIGGGGLISGIAVAAKALKPEHPPDRRAGGALSLHVQRHQGRAPADARRHAGRRHRRQGAGPHHPGRSCASSSTTSCWSPSSEIEHAVSLLINIEKTVVEGAGAAGLAAVLKQPERFKGRMLGLVLCGGNIDTRLLASVLTRELAREGRLTQLAIDLVDRPGTLAKVANIAGRGRRQHRRGLPPARLLATCRPRRAARGGHRDARPRAPARDGRRGSRRQASRSRCAATPEARADGRARRTMAGGDAADWRQLNRANWDERVPIHVRLADSTIAATPARRPGAARRHRGGRARARGRLARAAPAVPLRHGYADAGAARRRGGGPGFFRSGDRRGAGAGQGARPGDPGALRRGRCLRCAGRDRRAATPSISST